MIVVLHCGHYYKKTILEWLPCGSRSWVPTEVKQLMTTATTTGNYSYQELLPFSCTTHAIPGTAQFLATLANRVNQLKSNHHDSKYGHECPDFSQPPFPRDHHFTATIVRQWQRTYLSPQLVGWRSPIWPCFATGSQPCIITVTINVRFQRPLSPSFDQNLVYINLASQSMTEEGHTSRGQELWEWDYTKFSAFLVAIVIKLNISVVIIIIHIAYPPFPVPFYV